MLAVAERLGAKLKRDGPHRFGPCPLGCARRDGFIVTPSKHLFLCRPSQATGDAVDMAEHVLGISGRTRWRLCSGAIYPTTPATRLPSNARRASNRTMNAPLRSPHTRNDSARRRRRVAKTKALRVEALRDRGVLFLNAPHAMAYFAGAGLTPQRRLLRNSRYDKAIDYYGEGSNNGAEAPVKLATTPAILADIQNASGEVIGIYLTHLDPNKPEKWKPVGNPGNSPRKIQGHVKGGMIRLFGRPGATLAIGEGVELVLSWHQLGHGPEDVALASAVHLGQSEGCGSARERRSDHHSPIRPPVLATPSMTASGLVRGLSLFSARTLPCVMTTGRSAMAMTSSAVCTPV